MEFVPFDEIAGWCGNQHRRLVWDGEYLPPRDWLGLPAASIAARLRAADHRTRGPIETSLGTEVLDWHAARYSAEELYFLAARACCAWRCLRGLGPYPPACAGVHVAIREEAYVWALCSFWAKSSRPYLDRAARDLRGRYRGARCSSLPQEWSFVPERRGVL